jgi:hypothetical protein
MENPDLLPFLDEFEKVDITKMFDDAPDSPTIVSMINYFFS